MKNYYEILGVSEKATSSEIKKAYRRLAVEWHPDKHQDKETLPEAEVKFKEISEAYSTLISEGRRRKYDQERVGPSSFGRGGFYTTGDPFSFFTGGDFVFTRPDITTPPKFTGETIEVSHTLSLKDSLFGTERSISYSVKSPCSTCSARGALEFSDCLSCKGTGFITQGGDRMFIKSHCRTCRGRGKCATKPCEVCKGARLISEEKSVVVKVPPKIPHGSRLRLRGAGGQGSEGMPQGDLLVEVLVEYPDLDRLNEEEQEILKKLLTK